MTHVSQGTQGTNGNTTVPVKSTSWRLRLLGLAAAAVMFEWCHWETPFKATQALINLDTSDLPFHVIGTFLYDCNSDDVCLSDGTYCSWSLAHDRTQTTIDPCRNLESLVPIVWPPSRAGIRDRFDGIVVPHIVVEAAYSPTLAIAPAYWGRYRLTSDRNPKRTYLTRWLINSTHLEESIDWCRVDSCGRMLSCQFGHSRGPNRHLWVFRLNQREGQDGR